MKEIKIQEYKLGNDIVIAHVSDFHERTPEPVIKALQSIHPDIICITGDTFERNEEGNGVSWMDMVHLQGKDHISKLYPFKKMIYKKANRNDGTIQHRHHKNAYDFLQQASQIAPVYMSLGNHEWYLLDEDREFLNRYHINLLDNTDKTIDINGNHYLIGGLSTRFDKKWLDSFIAKGDKKILLMHHPEQRVLFDTSKINLILSGHWHGGQICIANTGLYCPNEGTFIKQPKGRRDNLIISAGCSNTSVIPRIGNPEEIGKIHF